MVQIKKTNFAFLISWTAITNYRLEHCYLLAIGRNWRRIGKNWRGRKEEQRND
jgi:hypothetical protein